LHYYLTPLTKDVLKFIKATSKKYHYFLLLDVRRYYPSISHKVLLQKLPQIHQALFQENPSRRLKRVFEKEIPAFPKSISFGLPVSSRLSRTLAVLFLLDLDLKIKNPFLRQVDDYLIFCRNKKEAEEVLDRVVLPKLKELNLPLNQRKLKSGRLYQDKVDFLGFEFYAGYFQIKDEKIKRFKRKIKSLTSLTHHYSEKNLIKLLNNQILGFGHYYKLASSKKAFQDLDAFIKMKLRRHLSAEKLSNLKKAI